MNIISIESGMSIRLIDYFVTKYSKINKIIYKFNDETVNVYASYKQQLKAFQKKHFDPFARGIRIPYFIKDSCIITTIGQLNFFNWFITKDILLYVFKNKDDIEIDMNKEKKIKEPKIKKKTKIYKKKDIKIPYITNNQNKTSNSILVTF